MVVITLSFGAGSDEANEALLFPVMYGLAWCVNSPLIVLFFRTMLEPIETQEEEKEGAEGGGDPSSEVKGETPFQTAQLESGNGAL
jgi:hypothetical protein